MTAKRRSQSVRDPWFFIIIAAAAALRFVRLFSLSEFLGDQGRTLLILRSWLTDGGPAPLAGPTTLSGHHLGPAFYYLLAPGYLMTGSETGVIIQSAFLGVLAVAVIYLTVRMLYGVIPARIAAALWAVSPHLVSADRTVWEPNLVPLFAALFSYMLVRAHRSGGRFPWLVLGAVTGILVQLHYPNILFILIVATYAAAMAVLKRRKTGTVLLDTALWAAGFLSALLPFIVFELQHGFADLRGIFSVIASGSGTPVGKREMLRLFLDYGARITGRMLPFVTTELSAVLLAFWGMFAYRHRTGMNALLTVWWVLGLLAMTRYRGVVHDHYLYFLMPVPFLALSSLLSTIKASDGKRWAIIAAGIIVLFRISQTDIARPAYGDLFRIRAVTSQVKADSLGESFTFTVIGGRSFSDLHYRYAFDAADLTPVSVTDPAVRMLFVVCEGVACPTAREISTSPIPVMCYDHHCSGAYPVIPAGAWMLVSRKQVAGSGTTGATLYRFRRMHRDVFARPPGLLVQ